MDQAAPGKAFSPREMEVWDYVIVQNRRKIAAGISNIDWKRAAQLWAKTVKVATLQDAKKQAQMRNPVYLRTSEQLKERMKTLLKNKT